MTAAVAWSADLLAAPALARLWCDAVDRSDGVALGLLARPGDDLEPALSMVASLGADVEAIDVADAVAGARAVRRARVLLSARPEALAYGVDVVAPETPPAELRARLGLGQRPEAARAAAPDYQARRIAELRELWECPRLTGEPELHQPAVLLGPGSISFGGGVILGWKRSPGFYTGSVYIEAGTAQSEVVIGDRTLLNNDVCVRSEGPGITIGRDGLFGTGVQVFDSDFHHLERARRRSGEHRKARVVIGDDVWVGANAMILKGVTIGDGAVVAAGAIVTRDVPPATLVAGNPARVVRGL